MARFTPQTGARFLAGNRGTSRDAPNRTPKKAPPAKQLHPELIEVRNGSVVAVRRADIGSATTAATDSGTYHIEHGRLGLPASAPLPDNGGYRGGSASVYKGNSGSVRR